MFPFITKTWNPVAGGPCIYNCEYCWAQALINDPNPKWDNLRKKYSGPMRLHCPAMKTRFKPDDFVFVVDMADIGNPDIPRGALIDIFEHIAFFKDTKFLLLTKNPYFYICWESHLPANVYLGATIETDLDLTIGYSGAPSTSYRISEMQALKEAYPDRPQFFCIEPIFNFSRHFQNRLIELNPWAVAVGYDNYKNELPEPTLEATERLIAALEAADIKVYRKTIRKAHYED